MKVKCKVKCIDDNGSWGRLQKDQEYEVIHWECNPDYYQLPNGVSWAKERFIVIGEYFKVKCIDDSQSEGLLKHGMIYDAIQSSKNDNRYDIRGLDVPSSWYKKRFILIKEEEDNEGDNEASIEDQEEKTLRKLLGPYVAPHECICGVARTACDYHR